jgi:uncharacterized coiled-coil protein SlyX
MKAIINRFNEKEKNDNEIINSLNSQVTEQKEEISSLKKSIKALNKKVNEQKEEISSSKNSINNLNNKSNEQKEEISILQKIVDEFKNKISFLLKNYIDDLDSLIIDNNNYNSTLKKWINPSKNIKANLLYRLSRDGSEIYKFHNLCDDKGPTLALFNLKIGEKIGFFVDDSFDSKSKWKNVQNTFLFNLNQEQKYIRTDSTSNTLYCRKNCGPSINGFGCNPHKSINYIYHSADTIDSIFKNASKLLPSENVEKEYEVIECEIFQIVID